MNPHPDHDLPLGLPAPAARMDSSPGRCVVLVPFQGRIVSKCQAGLLELERRGYAVRRPGGTGGRFGPPVFSCGGCTRTASPQLWATQALASQGPRQWHTFLPICE